MKTTEEINKLKAVLECCASDECHGEHRECPYHLTTILCVQTMAGEARAYINELEERLSLNTLRDVIYEDAVAHGLWDRDFGPTDCAELIRDEASELDSAAMDWECDDYNDDSEFCEELADVVIAAMSVAGYLGIDIDAAVKRKMEINKGRPWKHGKEPACNT